MVKAEECSRCKHPTTRRTVHGTVLCASCARPPKAKSLATPALTGEQLRTKFAGTAGTPGQGALSLDDDGPERIEEEAR